MWGFLRSERRKAELTWVLRRGGARLKIGDEERQPVLGGLVLLQTGGKRCVAQLIGQALAQRFASSVQ